jgi:hypothetical protein
MVSYSRNGKLLASVSLTDNIVAIWQPIQGFMTHFVGALSHSIIKPYRTFVAGDACVRKSYADIMADIKFEWVGDRSLRYTFFDNTLAFNV